MVVRIVPPELAERFWPLAEPFVASALGHAAGEYTTDDFKRLCLAGTLRLWLVCDGSRAVAAATGEIALYPRMRRLRIATIGGADFSAWADELDAAFDATAREYACDSIEMFVRRGFVPKLVRRGWHPNNVVVIRPVAAAAAQQPTPQLDEEVA